MVLITTPTLFQAENEALEVKLKHARLVDPKNLPFFILVQCKVQIWQLVFLLFLLRNNEFRNANKVKTNLHSIITISPA